MRIDIYETEVLIIGGGMAAVRAAIEAGSNGVSVALVSKAPVGKSGASAMAGGGMAAVAEGTDDNLDIHYEDMAAAGRGLGDKELAQILTREGPARVKDLIDYGVRFQRTDGVLGPQMSPGNRYPRTHHALGGGEAYLIPLRRKALSYPNVSFHEDVFAVKLLAENGCVVGALCYDLKPGELTAFLAGATILATGGYQDLYPLSSASVDMTGDGYALAFKAGAELVDMEMLLYYPTALITPRTLRGALVSYEYLLQEQGVGARVINANGEDVLDKYTPLPVRDILARRIFQEVRGGNQRGGVFVDISRSPRSYDERKELLKKSEPAYSLYSLLSSVGIDMANAKLEVAPAAHSVLGGVKINARCETTVPGLFAAGEVSGNVHGANRLGAHALTETQVFGRRAGLFAARYAREVGYPKISDTQIDQAARPLFVVSKPEETRVDPREVKSRIRQTMIECAGPTKDENSLLEGIQRINSMIDSDLPRLHASPDTPAFDYRVQEALEVRTMVTTALLVCHAALLRRESRGHHYRSDYPNQDQDRPPYRTVVMRKDGDLIADIRPVS